MWREALEIQQGVSGAQGERCLTDDSSVISRTNQNPRVELAVEASRCVIYAMEVLPVSSHAFPDRFCPPFPLGDGTANCRYLRI